MSSVSHTPPFIITPYTGPGTTAGNQPPATPPDQQPYIVAPFNQIIAAKHQGLKTAKRTALTTDCGAQGNEKRPPMARRRALKTIQINATVAGDNILIPGIAGIKQIFEMVLWNVSAQNLILQQGPSGAASTITLFQIPGMPATFGLFLGFNGSFEQPHFEIDNNQPFVLNLSAGTQVTGFIRYRIIAGQA